MRYDKTLKKLQEAWNHIQEQSVEESEKERFLRTPGNVFRVTEEPNNYFVVTNEYSHGDHSFPLIMGYRVGDKSYNRGKILAGMRGNGGDYIVVEIEEVREDEIEQISNEELKNYIINASEKYRKSDPIRHEIPSPESVYPPDYGPGEKRYRGD